MGLTFPIIFRTLTTEINRIGDWVGRIFGINTLGSILGSLASGFILIPFLGLKQGMLVTILILVLAGLVLILFHSQRKALFKVTFASAIVLLGIIGTQLRLPDHFFRQFTDKNQKLLFYKEGISGTVTVKQHGDHYKELSLNGTSLATSLYNHRQLFHISDYTIKRGPSIESCSIAIKKEDSLGRLEEEILWITFLPEIMDYH